MKSLCYPGMEVTSWVFKRSFQSHISENIFSSHFLLPNCSAAAFGFGFSAFICYCFSSVFSPHPSYLDGHFRTAPVLFVLISSTLPSFPRLFTVLHLNLSFRSNSYRKLSNLAFCLYVIITQN